MISEAYTQSALNISTTELSLTSGTSSIQARTTGGLYMVRIELVALATGDQFTLRRYEKVRSGGTQRAAIERVFVGGQSAPYFSGRFFLLNGWDWSLIKDVGTARNVDSSIVLLS